MIKNIFVGIILSAFFLLLVLGAVNRTLAKTQGSEPLALAENRSEYLSENQNEALEHDYNSENGLGQSRVFINSWTTISGTVESISPELWTIALTDGSFLEIKGQSLRFLNENGFFVEIGDQLNLIGFYETDQFEVGQIENLTQNTNAIIRDEYGLPLWSGRRRENTND